ncbi:MAG: hypothetical protein QOD77_1499 [Thermoplasmata archaeon]|jgi:hypothetical protein|nr:hypothetical protein [Thermoplasmata archaeon]
MVPNHDGPHPGPRYTVERTCPVCGRIALLPSPQPAGITTICKCGQWGWVSTGRFAAARPMDPEA